LIKTAIFLPDDNCCCIICSIWVFCQKSFQIL